MSLPGRRLLSVVTGIVVLALLSLGGAVNSGATTADKVTFTVGMVGDIDSLNPFTGIESSAYEMYQLNYETLTDYGQADFSTQPALAESWDASADGLTWTYHLRAGLKWSDGQPLTAKDVAYTLNRVRNGKYEQTNYGNDVSGLTSVVATDDSTVVMKVKKPTPIMEHLYVYILPEHIWKEVDEKEVKSFANNPGPDGIIGAGPFIVKERKTGQFIRLERNPNYYGEKPKIDELVFRVFQNQDSLAQALKRGEIDFADSLESNVFYSLENTPGIKTFQPPTAASTRSR